MEWSALWTLIPPLLVLVGLLLWLDRTRRQRQRLDSAWGWLGPGLDHQGSGRAWRGRIGPRRIEVIWADRTTTVWVSAHPRLRATLRRASGPAVAGPREEHFPKVTLAGGFLGWGPEPDRLEELARQGGVREALQELLVSAQPTLRQVRIEGQGVTFFVRNLWDRKLIEQDTQRWIQALLVLAHTAETEMVHPSSLGVNECP